MLASWLSSQCVYGVDLKEEMGEMKQSVTKTTQAERAGAKLN